MSIAVKRLIKVIFLIFVFQASTLAFADGTVGKVTVWCPTISWEPPDTYPCFQSDVAAAEEAMLIFGYGDFSGYTVDSVDCSNDTTNGGLCDVYWQGTTPEGGINYFMNGAGIHQESGCPGGSVLNAQGGCQCVPRYSPGPSTDAPACYPVASEVILTSQPKYPHCDIGNPFPSFGEPIYPMSGAESLTVQTGISTGAESISLTYDSGTSLQAAQLPAASVGGDLPLASNILGPSWVSSINRQLYIDQKLYGARAVRGDGSSVNFTGNGSGVFVSSSNVQDSLLQTSGGYKYYDVNGLAIEDYSPLLARVTSVSGASVAYTYSTAATPATIAPGAGYLVQAQDDFGRAVQFTYSTNGLLSQVIDAAGNVVGLTYNANSNISQINWPDGNNRQFLYENAAYPGVFTGIVDEAGARFSTVGYGALGIANSSQLGGGVDTYGVTYSGAAPLISVVDVFNSTYSVNYRTRSWSAIDATVLTLPNGQTSTLTSSLIMGQPMLSGQSQPAGSGCSASASAQSYDAVGNVLSHDDFDGNRRCFAYDTARNLLLVRLEGLPTSKACPTTLSSYAPAPVDSAHPERKTTTVWHPNWVLKTQEAKPEKITTWVYNGQPDPISGGTASCAPSTATLPDGNPIVVLCSRYEQATSDATGGLGLSAMTKGAARQWTYTYNQYGQVLAATTPKQSSTDVLSHTTTYTYYATTNLSSGVGQTMGDLQTETNPLGQTTTFTTYDAVGRLLSSTDANGTVTAQTYTARGWVQSQTVTPSAAAALTTTYAYWPTGLLNVVTMPDGSTLTYGYDTAHRLTDITDGAGNKVHYVLDNSGNRTSEQVSDESGNLASTVARVFDALNRVQSITGATQ